MREEFKEFVTQNPFERKYKIASNDTPRLLTISSALSVLASAHPHPPSTPGLEQMSSLDLGPTLSLSVGMLGFSLYMNMYTLATFFTFIKRIAGFRIMEQIEPEIHRFGSCQPYEMENTNFAN